MKKFIQNAFLVFVICFTILNVIEIIFSTIDYYDKLYGVVGPIIQGELNEETIEEENRIHDRYTTAYGDNAPVATLSYVQGYLLGQQNILHLQKKIVIISTTVGISTGIIISLIKNRKSKE